MDDSIYSRNVPVQQQLLVYHLKTLSREQIRDIKKKDKINIYFVCVIESDLIFAMSDSQVISKPGHDDFLMLQIFEWSPFVIG